MHKEGNMLENATLWERIRLWLSDFDFMEKPLAFIEQMAERVSDAFGEFFSYVIYMRYIVYLFLLTILFVVAKILYKWISGLFKASFSPSSFSYRMKFWERYQLEDEKRSLSDIKEIIQSEEKVAFFREKVEQCRPMGDLLAQIVSAVEQGMNDADIVKMFPSHYSLMDILPLVETIRGFRDLAAQKILNKKSKDRRSYEKALNELSTGRPGKAIGLMKKELINQQRVLFGLKNRLLQQYARKEASRLSLHLALLTGVYDTRLADKAFRRAMELNPKDSKSRILFARFRQRTFGSHDKVMEKTFMSLVKGIDKTLQTYMIDYAVQMVRKTEIKKRQEEVKNRIQDEKERFNAAVSVERLKVQESLRLARLKSIADEVHIR